MKFNKLFGKLYNRVKNQEYVDDSDKNDIKSYSVPKLIELSEDLPEKSYDLKDLERQIYKDTPWGEGLTISDVLNDPKKYMDHMKRIKNSDLSYPILIAPNGEIADGNHRLAKAVMNKENTIKAKVFPDNESMQGARVE
jgi:disulfide oxidoreductase YuzD